MRREIIRSWLRVAVAAALALGGSTAALADEAAAEVFEAPVEMQQADEEVATGLAEHPGDSWGPIGWFRRWRWSSNNPEAAEFMEKHPEAGKWARENKEKARKAVDIAKGKAKGKVKWGDAAELRGRERAMAAKSMGKGKGQAKGHERAMENLSREPGKPDQAGKSGEAHGKAGEKGQAGDAHGKAGEKGKSGDAHGKSAGKGKSGR